MSVHARELRFYLQLCLCRCVCVPVLLSVSVSVPVLVAAPVPTAVLLAVCMCMCDAVLCSYIHTPQVLTFGQRGKEVSQNTCLSAPRVL